MYCTTTLEQSNVTQAACETLKQVSTWPGTHAVILLEFRFS